MYYMDVGTIILLVLLIVFAAIVVIAFLGKKKSKTERDKKNVSLDQPESKSVIFSADFGKSEMPGKAKLPAGAKPRMEDGHIVWTIMRSEPDPDVWVCRSCETENPGPRTRCMVCDQSR